MTIPTVAQANEYALKRTRFQHLYKDFLKTKTSELVNKLIVDPIIEEMRREGVHEKIYQNVEVNSVKVTKDGENLYSNAIGYASVTDSIKNNVDTKFRIGSISKTFTATIIYQLIEAGKLSLDTKLSTYFPKIKHSEEITIKELLNHRSGIYNFTTSPAFPYMMYNETSHEDLLELIYNF